MWCEASDPANTTFESGTDTPLAGIRLRVFADTDCDQTPDGNRLMRTDTDANGQYRFAGLSLLPPGSNSCYVVRVNTNDQDLGTCDHWDPS